MRHSFILDRHSRKNSTHTRGAEAAKYHPPQPARYHHVEGHNETDPEADPEAAAAELLRVNEPAAIAPRGRPPGAKNKQKKRTREQAFEDSTQREPSRFEHVHLHQGEAVRQEKDQVVLHIHPYQGEAVFGLYNSHLDDVAEAAEELHQEVDKELH